MKEKSREMVLNEDYYTVAANDIIKGKQAMKLQTARLIRLAITQVAQQDKALQTSTVSITNLAEFLNISRDNLYRDIREICKQAMESVVYIGTPNPKNPWKMIHWIGCAEYDGAGELTIKLSHELKPYVLELDKWFTQYQLKNILEFTSFYAIRLYEILKCAEGEDPYENKGREYYYTIEELRQFFGCEDKYERVSQFKAKTIEVAVREINEKSDIEVYHEYKKRGREVVGVTFGVTMNYRKYRERKFE